MFGPKSRANYGRTLATTTAPGKSSKKSADAQQKVASQVSLAAAAAAGAGKSASRSSLASESLSVCSSSLLPPGSPSQRNSQSNLASSASNGASDTNTKRLQPVRPSSSSSSSAPRPTSSKLSSGIRRTSSSVSTTSSVSTKAAPSTASTTAQQRQRVPTLAMSLRDKDQQIKLLIKERDEQKFQAELMAQRAEQWEEKYMASELERSHVTSEADDEVVELRRLAQELEDENRRLGERLQHQEQMAGDLQFKLDELECEREGLRRELEDKEAELELVEQERQVVERGEKSGPQIQTERQQSRAKYEREIEELKERILSRDEQMIQLRSSLEMRKQEVANLQAHAGDLERRLKIESERSERHLKRIDEINLELKASEAKLATKSEESEMQEKQVRQLRQELRVAEEKLEQQSLARKKDMDILHHKLAAARRGSTTPTSPQPNSNFPKTPTPQDEIVRLQMELRDLKDQLIDREAELDCQRRDMEVLRRKMETRTLEVDCNNQELARRCQDLLEQNRQSEETVKQLLKSTSEHSSQLMRATEDLKEANGKCVRLRDEINELELKLDEQLRRSTQLNRDNQELADENEELKEQVETLRRQLGDLCSQLDQQTASLHKDRECLAEQLTQNELDGAQLRHDLATAKQDLRTQRLQTQEALGERDRLKSELEIKEKYVSSRNDIIETMRHELEDCKRSLADYRLKLEQLRQHQEMEGDEESCSNQVQVAKELRAHLEALKRDCQLKAEENESLKGRCDELAKQMETIRSQQDEEELSRFEEMRSKHRGELDEFRNTIRSLEEALSFSKSPQRELEGCSKEQAEGKKVKPQEDYERQIEFLNSVVVDMQRKCDDYKNRLAQMETMNIMNEFDHLILNNQPSLSVSVSGAQQTGAAPTTSPVRASTLARSNGHHVSFAPTISVANVGTLNRSFNGKPNSLQANGISLGANNVDKLESFRKAQTQTRISGRPYCDICSVYDLHHTVYCPKVSEKLLGRNCQTLEPSSNNNNSANIFDLNKAAVDDLFREYEQSLQEASTDSRRQFSSLRRPTTAPRAPSPRPYCDHCDLFGHTIKACQLLKL